MSKTVFGMARYSLRLCDLARKSLNRVMMKHFLGFSSQLWAVVTKSGESHGGFEQCQWTALEALISGRSAAETAAQFRKRAAAWATYWLCEMILSACNDRWSEALMTFQRTLGLLNNAIGVASYDQ